MGIVLWADESLLNDAGVRDIEAARTAVASIPLFEQVRAVTRTPILTNRDGALVAETPLWPPPANDGGWTTARSLVLSDPFVRGPLINDPGDTTVIVGWIRSLNADQALVALVGQWLLRPEQDDSDGARRVREAIAAARLAVGLGEVTGSPDAEVARRIRALGAVGRGQRTEGNEQPALALAGLIDRWIARSEAVASNPEAEATRQLQDAVMGLRLSAGTQAAPFGAPFVEQGLREAYPWGIVLSLVGFLIVGFSCVASKRGLLAGGLSALAGATSFGYSLGFLGWLGLPAGPLAALTALVTTAWTFVLLLRGSWTPAGLIRGGAALGLPLLLLAPSGACKTVWFTAFFGITIAMLLTATLLPQSGNSSGSEQLVNPFPAGLPGATTSQRRWLYPVLVVLCLVALRMPLHSGRNPGFLLVGDHALTGEETSALGSAVLRDRMGGVPPLFLVAESDEPGGLASPAAIAALGDATQEATKAGQVQSATSWTDLVATLHRNLGGDGAGLLPSTKDAVDQYLLLLGRPQDTRAFVSSDQRLALARLQLRPGEGKGRASHRQGLLDLYDEYWPNADTPRLAGEALEMSVAAREQAHSLLVGLVLAALLLVPVLTWRRATSLASALTLSSRFCLHAATIALGSVALAAISLAITPERLVAAALIYGLSIHAMAARDIQSQRSLGLLVVGGGTPLLFSSVVPLIDVGLMLVVGGLLVSLWPGSGRTAPESDEDPLDD